LQNVVKSFNLNERVSFIQDEHQGEGLKIIWQSNSGI
jgi:hypothetical protein